MASDSIGSDHISRIIGHVYDAALDPEQWSVALEEAGAFVGGAAANIFWQDAISQSAAVFHSWGR